MQTPPYYRQFTLLRESRIHDSISTCIVQTPDLHNIDPDSAVALGICIKEMKKKAAYGNVFTGR